MAPSIAEGKLKTDLVWSLGSLVILASSGILINFSVMLLRDAAALGVFNQAYAVYIIASQFAVWGIQYSVLRNAALNVEQPDVRDRLLGTAGLLSLGLGLIAAGLVFVAAVPIGRLVDSPDVAAALRLAAVGLIFFPLNKVLLAYLNGLGAMKAFSLLQAMRYITVMVWVTVVAASKVDFNYATLGFFVAESLTVAGAALWIAKEKLAARPRYDHGWAKSHLEFGGKSLLAGMFVELNSRVDVLLLGIFMPDRTVGIYSFAAMLADGLYHLLAVVKINFNPLLAQATRDNNLESARGLLAKARRFGTPAAGVVSVALLASFVIAALYVVPNKGLMEGFMCAVVLLGTLSLVAPFVPFDNLVMMSGYPVHQTIQQMILVSSNAIVGMLAIPVFGMVGAAIGTAAGFICGTAALIYFSRRLLGWNLLTNTLEKRKGAEGA